MSQRLKKTFSQAKAVKKPVFLAYVTAGFPTFKDTVPLLLALQEGGADIIEVGVPHSDPIGDGNVIQTASNGNKLSLFFFQHSHSKLLWLEE